MSDALDHWLNLGQSAELRRLDALVKEQAQEIDELRKANEAFAKRQVWWNDRMFELEQELERLKAQRVPLTEEQIWASDDIMACNSLMGVEFDTLVRVVRATEIAHGIHPLQRLADLSKEIGEKL